MLAPVGEESRKLSNHFMKNLSINNQFSAGKLLHTVKILITRWWFTVSAEAIGQQFLVKRPAGLPLGYPAGVTHF
ncbi:hypothetical protein [Vreelandella venusta]|uniref:Uncharacterized protein n=1 Tax=Vreelandella venusta TaxID=44935 RepID=A0AAQ0CGI1_9GAMM|nr:hypothetical protein [Halomonas venusta]AZM97111.1 hypothetical protein EI420_16170 [Halomonas venusta]NPT31830.1 hypothetical protein [Halomonas venusta]QPI63391.1 hypothetical protein IR195_16190 [Halomonas venusta]QRL02590.1 hypothetical protein JDS37_14985 [Halomonas venusta]GEK49310.1 hypothetical protein HVE01_00310 [Halomonas venusta]